MKEWQQYANVIELQHVQFNWTFRGELKLDLVLVGPKDIELGRPYFEMARTLRSTSLISMVHPIEQEYGKKAIESDGSFLDCFWKGTLEELEQFCSESLLPLPDDYKEAWAITSQVSNN